MRNERSNVVPVNDWMGVQIMSTPTTDTAGIRQVIRVLRAAGWELSSVDNGEERVPVTTEAEALAATTEVDMSRLIVTKPVDPAGALRGWVLFVMGNGDPVDLVADWTLNLSDALDPLTDSWCES
jgi:hypothetical protein